jgi:hypothetical protein
MGAPRKPDKGVVVRGFGEGQAFQEIGIGEDIRQRIQFAGTGARGDITAEQRGGIFLQRPHGIGS